MDLAGYNTGKSTACYSTRARHNVIRTAINAIPIHKKSKKKKEKEETNLPNTPDKTSLPTTPQSSSSPPPNPPLVPPLLSLPPQMIRLPQRPILPHKLPHIPAVAASFLQKRLRHRLGHRLGVRHRVHETAVQRGRRERLQRLVHFLLSRAPLALLHARVEQRALGAVARGMQPRFECR